MSKKVTQEKKEKEQRQSDLSMRQRYQNVFTSPEGWEVFKHLLGILGYFGNIDTEEERIRYNFANELVLDVLGAEGTDAIDAKMLGVRKYIETKKK